jgi:hypothetical protein
MVLHHSFSISQPEEAPHSDYSLLVQQSSRAGSTLPVHSTIFKSSPSCNSYTIFHFNHQYFPLSITLSDFLFTRLLTHSHPPSLKVWLFLSQSLFAHNNLNAHISLSISSFPIHFPLSISVSILFTNCPILYSYWLHYYQPSNSYSHNSDSLVFPHNLKLRY